MLVLTRKVGERIVIGSPHSEEEVIVTVASIDRNRVRLSFDASRTVSINRSELEPETNAKRSIGKISDG